MIDIKRRDYKLVEMALEKGVLIKPDSCTRCGNWCKPLGHHNDYNYALDVVWLCRSCHKLIHKRYAGKWPFNWKPPSDL